MNQQPFGNLSAEDDLAPFNSRYYPHLSENRLELARHRNCRFVVGRRGSGKTALAQYLRTQAKDPYDAFVMINQSGTTFSRIHKEVDSALARRGMPFLDDVARLWQLALWTGLMTGLDRSGLLKSPAVKTYLSVAHGTFIQGTQVLLDGLASVLSSSGAQLLDSDRLQPVLEQASYPRALEDTHNCLSHLRRVAIVVDTPEDTLKSPAQTASVMALFMAVNWSGADLPEKVHVKCLVPSEVWAHLTAKMAGKDRYQPLEIRWSPSELMCLACYRYNAFLAEHDWERAVQPGIVSWESPTDVRAKVWDHFFPGKAEGRGRLLEDSRDLIVRHTQLRPRQVIGLCNAIAAKSALRRFNPNHVSGGLADRVEWFAAEVFASYADIHGDAEELLTEHLRNRPAVFRSESIDAPNEFWTIAYQIGAVAPVTGKSARFFGESEFESYQAAEFEFCGGPRRWTPHHELVAVHPIFHKQFNIKETADTLVGFRGWWEGAALF